MALSASLLLLHSQAIRHSKVPRTSPSSEKLLHTSRRACIRYGCLDEDQKEINHAQACSWFTEDLSCSVSAQSPPAVSS